LPIDLVSLSRHLRGHPRGAALQFVGTWSAFSPAPALKRVTRIAPAAPRVPWGVPPPHL